MRWLFVLAIILSGCATPWPEPFYQTPPPTPLSDLRGIDWLGPKPTLDDLETYVDNFRKLAFWTEWHGRHPYVKKWRDLSFCVPEKYREPIKNTLRKLRVATGLELRTSGPCNVTFVERANSRGCTGAFVPVQGNLYAGAEIRIKPRPDNSECIEEEISQLMGLYNDIPYRWTLWNDETNGTVNRLTWHDAVMLRVLYQQELHRGMPEAEAMRIVPRLMRKVISEIQ